jgi:predicted transcriptional regulator
MATSTKEARWTESFRVRVSPETFAQAKRVAREREATVSQLARQALVRYLEQEQAR